MASDDIYVRKDVYEADQRALRNEIKAGNQEILRALEQFKSEVNSRFDKFEGEVNSRFDKLESRVGALESRVGALEEKVEYVGTALYDRISDTHTYMGWGFATLGIVVAIAVVALPALKLFKVIKEHFRPSVTIEQVREIAREEIAKVLPQLRQ